MLWRCFGSNRISNSFHFASSLSSTGKSPCFRQLTSKTQRFEKRSSGSFKALFSLPGCAFDCFTACYSVKHS